MRRDEQNTQMTATNETSRGVATDTDDISSLSVDYAFARRS